MVGELHVAPGDVVTVRVGGGPTTRVGCFDACVGGFNGGGNGGPRGSRRRRRIRPPHRWRRSGAPGPGRGWRRRRRGRETSAPAAWEETGGAREPTVRSVSAKAAGTGGGAGTQTAGGIGGSPAGANGTLGSGGDGEASALNGGGGGGGGLYGGGSGGSGPVLVEPTLLATPGSGGGGGSSLVPAGGVVNRDPRSIARIAIEYVEPGVAPSLGPIAGVTVAADPGACAAANVSAPSVTVSGDPAPTVSYRPALPGSFPVGVTTVTATATNGVSPDAAASFAVTVQDRQPPTLSAVTSPIVIPQAGPSGAAVTYSAPTALDNCAGVTLARTAGPASGSTFPLGDTTVTYTATDAAGSTASVSFVVRVSDATAPSISAVITPTPDSAGWNRTPVTVTYTCADSGSGIASCSPAQSFIAEGPSTYAGTATDTAGNSTSTTGTVKIDTIAPTVSVTGPAPGVTYNAANVPAVACSTNDATSGGREPCDRHLGGRDEQQRHRDLRRRIGCGRQSCGPGVDHVPGDTDGRPEGRAGRTGERRQELDLRRHGHRHQQRAERSSRECADGPSRRRPPRHERPGRHDP